MQEDGATDVAREESSVGGMGVRSEYGDGDLVAIGQERCAGVGDEQAARTVTNDGHGVLSDKADKDGMEPTEQVKNNVPMTHGAVWMAECVEVRG